MLCEVFLANAAIRSSLQEHRMRIPHGKRDLKRRIERIPPCPAGRNQRPIDIKQNDLHGEDFSV
jgi:hypothetical protein